MSDKKQPHELELEKARELYSVTKNVKIIPEDMDVVNSDNFAVMRDLYESAYTMHKEHYEDMIAKLTCKLAEQAQKIGEQKYNDERIEKLEQENKVRQIELKELIKQIKEI